MRDTRGELLNAAFRVLEEQGPHALQARKLTAEIGASTMTVYTHFGGMPGLLDTMVREGLARFAAHVRENPQSDDPMADLIAGGLAYGQFATQNSQLYRLMFGLADTSRVRGAPDPATTWDMAEGVDAFSVLLGAVERVIDAGEIRTQDSREAATQILSVTHGYLLLSIGGFIVEELPGVMPSLAVNLMVGLGADRAKTERSLERALEIRAAVGAIGPPA